MRMHGSFIMAAGLAAIACSSDIVPSEGKQKLKEKRDLRSAAPNGGTVTRQQRRYAERQANKRMK